MYQLFDTLNCMEQISASALTIALVAFVTYLWLRSVAHRRATSAIQRAQSHSFWCALIAFFTSTSSDLSQVWSAPGESQSMLARVLIVLSGAGWLALVYIIGLFTWPKELQAVRVASLEPRSLATPFPRRLGAFVGALAIFAFCMLWPMSQVTADVSKGGSEGSATGDYADIPGADWDRLSRWRSGTEVAPMFALCILAVLLATAVITLIILKRKPLAGISAAHNQELRSVWLNRLLRNCGWSLIGITGAAITYAKPVLGDGWNTVPTFAFVGLGFILFIWAPKFAAPMAGKNSSTTAFTRMRDHTLAVSFIANTVAIAAAYIIGIAASQLFDQASMSRGPARAKFESSEFMLLWGAATVVLYLAISAGFALYAHQRAKLGSSRAPESRNLPVWVYTAAALFIISGSVLLYAPQSLSPGTELVVSPWITTGIIAGLLVFAAGYLWWIRHCSVPWDLTAAQEIWYRQILEFRALRVLCSAFLLLPGLASSDEPAVIAIGVGLFCIPSLLVVKRPEARISTSTSA